MTHSMSGDVPAYEFPSGDDTVRVLARKHRTLALWLITAWAADGANRNVSVYIPELGQLTLEARSVGSVYKASLASGKVTLIRIDNEGATYTAVADGAPLITALNLALPLPAVAERLLWLSADSGVTLDSAGKVTDWAGLGNGLTVKQTDATRRPILVPNAVSGKHALRFVNGQTWLSVNPTGAISNAFIGNLNIFAVFTGAGLNQNNRVIAGRSGGGNDYGNTGFNLNNGVVDLSEINKGVLIRNVGGSLSAALSTLTVGDGIGGAGPGGGFGLTGDIAEILVYKGLSQGRQSQIIEYLKDKYRYDNTTVLANGSFESPTVSGIRYTPNASAGWFFTNSALIQANNSVWAAAPAPAGNQTAVLQGNDHAPLPTISQNVRFHAGNYNLRFKAARHSGTIQAIRVMIDGSPIGGLITAPSNEFTEVTTVTFSATAGPHVLRFEAVGGTGDRAILLDQVSLNIVTQVAQGSFEMPSVSGFQFYPSGSEWTFDSYSGLQANGSGLNASAAPEGIQTAVVQGSSAGLGSLSQAVHFGVGGNYFVSLKAARRTGQIQPLQFSVDGIPVGDLITPTSDAFATYATDGFTVPPGSHLLRFEATTSIGDQSTFIDDVVLSAPFLLTTLAQGSFETPSVSGGFVYGPTGSAWAFNTGSAIQGNGSAWEALAAPDGVQTAVLQGSPTNLGSISQALNFAAGTYSLSIKSARRAYDGAGVQPIRFMVDGTQIGTLMTPQSTQFTLNTTASFPVAAGSHTLRFEATDGNVAGRSSFIDQVSLNVISLVGVPLAINRFTRDNGGNYLIDFVGAPLTTYQVTKSDLASSFRALTLQLSATTNASGIGQALVPASEAAEPKEFYRIEK